MPGHDKITATGRNFHKQIAELQKLEVRVGYQHGAEITENGVDLADVVMWNELGTEHSPPRPFLRQSVENNESKISAMCKAQIQAIARGETDARGALQAIGAMQKGLIQETIRSGSFEPNAPATIENKGSSRPLIETGQMRQSVGIVITKRGSD